MDKNGQLNFEDDPLLSRSNEIYEFIAEGKFKEAITIINKLMNINPDYPGIAEAYRTSKFWQNREKYIKYDKKEKGKRNEKETKNEKEKADSLMKEWFVYEEYALSKNMQSSASYKAAMKYIFSKASEHYKLAFQKNENSNNKFDLLISLGECFLRLKEYQYAVETLEFAKNSYTANAKLLYILGESYYHIDDKPKSLLNFKEAFFVDPSKIDISLILADPILQIIDIINKSGNKYKDVREWIPVYGFISDIFYVRRNINKHQFESLKKEVFNLENNFIKLNREEVKSTNILPRMLNKYLWLLDYYQNQNINIENIDQIRNRLLTLEEKLFEDFFKKNSHN